MKKILFSTAVLFTAATSVFAGGIVTNTNQSAAYLRTMARGTTSDLDAIYYNPAGLAWNENEGWALSFNYQAAFQERNNHATYTVMGQEFNKTYNGTATAPFIPSLYAAYKTGDWAFSGAFNIIGGGGNAEFEDGLAMFDSQVRLGMANNLGGFAQILGVNVHDLYDLNSTLEGSQIIYTVQLGATYKITDWLSAYAGVRANYYNGNNSGWLNASVKDAYAPIYQANTQAPNATLAALELDVDQTGFGITPIVGLSAKWNNWTVGLKYEFLTKLELENSTNTLERPESFKDAVAAYEDGVKTDNDIPAILTAAVGYEFIPGLRATAEYHYYFEDKADMAGGKQEYLDRGCQEVLASIEWDINDTWTVSGGWQRTMYGVTDNFQSDMAFYCDSHAMGIGGAYRVNEKIRLNLGYMLTFYEDYTKDNYQAYPIQNALIRKDIFERKSQVVGLGIDYTF